MDGKRASAFGGLLLAGGMLGMVAAAKDR